MIEPAKKKEKVFRDEMDLLRAITGPLIEREKTRGDCRGTNCVIDKVYTARALRKLETE